MAAIRPFCGLRYRADAGPLEALIAPPYDVLTPAERDEYAARNPYNIVHLTLPEQHVDDRSKYVKYARSAAALAEWRRNGVLVPEPEPALYRYTQTFNLRGAGEAFTRTTLLALIKVEPYANGVVLPHEQTFPKHKEDRLRILEATRSHLESIFGLYEDPDGRINDAVRDAPAGGAASAEADGIQHTLEPINDPEAIAQIVALLADKKVWIADGHHRYETALAFREALGERDSEVPEDYMMMALGSMSDPGLVLLPTHRVVNLPISRAQALTILGDVFHIAEHHNRNLFEPLAQGPAHTFAMATEGGVGYILTPKDPAALVAMIEGEGSDALKSLDVSILHHVIFARLLGVKGTDGITYTRDNFEAIRLADQGDGTAFLMNPPTVDDMRTIALGGEKMPQKSTFYYPKLASGLVVWSLNDFS